MAGHRENSGPGPNTCTPLTMRLMGGGEGRRDRYSYTVDRKREERVKKDREEWREERKIEQKTQTGEALQNNNWHSRIWNILFHISGSASEKLATDQTGAR